MPPPLPCKCLPYIEPGVCILGPWGTHRLVRLLAPPPEEVALIPTEAGPSPPVHEPTPLPHSYSQQPPSLSGIRGHCTTLSDSKYYLLALGSSCTSGFWMLLENAREIKTQPPSAPLPSICPLKRCVAFHQVCLGGPPYRAEAFSFEVTGGAGLAALDFGFKGWVPYNPGWSLTHCAAEDDLETLLFLPPPPSTSITGVASL